MNTLSIDLYGSPATIAVDGTPAQAVTEYEGSADQLGETPSVDVALTVNWRGGVYAVTAQRGTDGEWASHHSEELRADLSDYEEELVDADALTPTLEASMQDFDNAVIELGETVYDANQATQFSADPGDALYEIETVSGDVKHPAIRRFLSEYHARVGAEAGQPDKTAELYSPGIAVGGHNFHCYRVDDCYLAELVIYDQSGGQNRAVRQLALVDRDFVDELGAAEVGTRYGDSARTEAWRTVFEETFLPGPAVKTATLPGLENIDKPTPSTGYDY